MTFKTLGVAAAAALMAATAGAAAAQAPAQPGVDAARRLDPEARKAQRAERLRAALQLRPDQEPALTAFLNSAKRPDRARGQRRQEMAQLTTPQRLDRMRERMAERQAAFDQRAAATKRFYAQLTPAQQKAFDALRPMDGRHGKGGRHGMRGGMRG